MAAELKETLEPRATETTAEATRNLLDDIIEKGKIGQTPEERTSGKLWLADLVRDVMSGQMTVSNDTEFFCSMDPGVVSEWPAVCPVCNMDLVRRKKGEAVVLPEGVVARMQFSPYRIQLAVK